MLNDDKYAALVDLEAHAAWPLRSCAVTDELGTLLVDPEVFFTPGAEHEEAAKTVCGGCPVLGACRSYALGGTGWWESDGIWGGMTVEERRAERRSQRKRRTRDARQGEQRPTPVENWMPSPAQEALLQVLADCPDLRAAADTMSTPFPNTRWVYSQLCEQLGLHQDELPVAEVVKQATARCADSLATKERMGVAA
ncbi:WhiB family transcriptional regulator [Streptomyces sp. NPDC012765]|uniref:WhiB family transcriptional regulator n=1 Tax=Streptomyces sp. NPDC012765 TaxID=3155249 RepID=UPI0033C0A017